MVIIERLRALGQRRELEGNYVDQNICEAAIELIEELMAKSRTEKKIAKVMHKWGKGEEHSGSKHGPVVPHTKAGQKQALAIAYSEARRGKKK